MRVDFAKGREETKAHARGRPLCQAGVLLAISAILMPLGACSRFRSGRAQQKSDEVFRQSPALQGPKGEKG